MKQVRQFLSDASVDAINIQINALLAAEYLSQSMVLIVYNFTKYAQLRVSICVCSLGNLILKV